MHIYISPPSASLNYLRTYWQRWWRVSVHPRETPLNLTYSFTSTLTWTIQSLLNCSSHYKADTVAIVLHDYGARYAPSPTLLLYAIHRTKLGKATLCKNQLPAPGQRGHSLAFTRYCYCQYCIVYGIHKGFRVGVRILRNHCAIVLQQCGQCRRTNDWYVHKTTRSNTGQGTAFSSTLLLGTAAPTTTDTGNTVPQRPKPVNTATIRFPVSNESLSLFWHFLAFGCLSR